ncbi:S-layer homology domain-containing protein [Anaerovorax odorimutans]|uniref:S-layer homology domain-containing protein n=1 Tax=Anaerovorax odorimutans TaxID=109327 RepID=UPI00042723A9|nr:S-layer homology domain-containing protein [Anaerovorax odorimutans]
MKRSFMRGVAVFLTVIMMIGVFPLKVLAEELQTPDTYSLNNGFLEVTVSAKNGGFDIRTVEGDKLNKDDNNKNLLFPRGENDTSFTSFRVTRDGKTKDYIFGGKYSFLGLMDHQVKVTQDAAGITAQWEVDDLKFTQRIELANAGSNNHGMAYISYTAETTGSKADISARILMDTALGYQDYAIYEMAGTDGKYKRVEKESEFPNTDGSLYEKTFFAYDDVNNPTILAYTVNASINEQECKPDKVAFGHWNNLAASVFDFTPDTDLSFTNPNNKKYLTADSAYALYYNIGTVTNESSKSIATYYGVYSNEKVSDNNTVSVNMTAPSSMKLAEDNKTYKSEFEGGDDGDFTIQTSIENFKTNTAKKYEKVKVAAYCQTGITPVSDDNVIQTDTSYVNPYTKEINDFKVDETKTISWNFNASIGAEAAYRKVHFKVYNVSADVDPTGSGQLLEENLLGEGMCYILCPGGDGKLPEIKFTGISPDIIYNEGTRHLFLTGDNFNMLSNKSEYKVLARPVTGEGKAYKIPAEQFLINEEDNTIDVVLNDTMAVGNYQLVISYTDTGKKEIAAPAMKFAVSDDKAYRNDGYGVIAVIQKKGTSYDQSQYEIKTFGSETAYEKGKNDLGEVLLELKGEISAADQVAPDGTVLKYTGVSTGSSDNVMTLNNCIDIENGSVSVSIENYNQPNQAINVDFDAELYTTGARTTIWKGGVSALTSIKNGTDYELIPFDKNGKRQSNPDPMANKETITLIWPSAAGAAQTIAGMIFEFRYGELGVIKDNGSELRRVIGFGANLDLSFLIPNNAEKSPVQLDLFDKINLTFFEDRSYTSQHMRSAWEYHKDQVRMDQKADEGVGSIKVKDILFGGEYIGFNTTVELQIPGYTPAMPTMAAKLTINTIGDWQVGVAGKCKFTKMEVEAEIYIKSKDGYPVPDKLYFFIKGFKPGVNVDGFGVVWLQGGGGGIDKLYDTIFATDSVPPLKILLSAQLSIMQVFSAKADLSLSLRGLGIKVSDGVITDTDIKVLNHAQLQFDWYPEFYFLASVSVNVLNIISGGGYIVVQDDGFFEFYVKAGIKIPDEVFFIGGIHLGSVDLGANSDKIWGGIEVIGIKAGVCYYWGGDVDFGFGGNAPEPSFPELLGTDDIPVYKDPETGKLLYMHVGTNFELAAQPELAEDIDSATVLMDGTTSAVVKSKADKKLHLLNLGNREGDNDAILSMTYSAETKAEAMELAKNIQVKDNNGTSYEIKIYNQDLDANSVENSNSNANLTYNTDTKKASLNVTFTTDEVYNKEWNIETPDAAADLLLYNVRPMASLDNVSASLANGNKLTVNWNGSELNQFEKLSFMAVKNDQDKEESLIYKLDKSSGIIDGAKKVTFELPHSLESGEYYLKVIASKEGELCETAVSADKFQFTNTKLPFSPKSVSAVNGGDYQIDANVEAPDGDYDGYLINVYEKESDNSWTLSEYGGMAYIKDTKKLSVGGRNSYTYTVTDENGDPVIENGAEKTETVTRGLEEGKVYRLGVAAYKEDASSDTGDPIIFYSSETFSNEIILSKPEPANVQFTASGAVEVGYSNGEAQNVMIDTFRTNNITFNLKSDQSVSGRWYLDTGYQWADGDGTKNTAGLSEEIINSDNSKIVLNEIEDGNHTLMFIGTNSAGDGVLAQKRFAVDTLPPRLMLEEPINGGFFETDGTLEVKGITDKGTKININGTEYSPSIDSSGRFSQTINLNKTMASQNVTVLVKDKAGNETVKTVTVNNKALGKIDTLKLYADGVDITNKSLTGGKQSDAEFVKNLILKASVQSSDKNEEGEIVLNNSSLVSWDTAAISGAASVTDEGMLTVGAGAQGMVLGKLMVSEDGGYTAAAVFGSQSSGSITGDTYYNINVIQPSEGGKIEISQISAKQDSVIKVTAVPTEGYRLKQVIVNQAGIEGNSFTMPGRNVTVTAQFEKISGGNSNGSSGKSNDKSYVITASAGENGTISPSGSVDVDKNSERTFTITPSEGYEIKDVLVDGKSIGVVKKYNFENITEKHTIKAVFAKASQVSDLIFDKFTDVRGHWAEEYIRAVVERGLFKGVTDTVFAPEQGMTRGMFVTVLGRMGNVESKADDTQYSDVAEKSYYAPYVSWAGKYGIVKGVSEGIFQPDNLVTREQIAVFLYRYAQCQNYDLTYEEKVNTSDYKDIEDISEYARESVEWALSSEIFKGSNNNMLYPKNTATRAEVSALILRFINKCNTKEETKETKEK